MDMADTDKVIKVRRYPAPIDGIRVAASERRIP
jgi:hypothetical protein